MVQMQLFPVDVAVPVTGDPFLAQTLRGVVIDGFPRIAERGVRGLEIRWNTRLRTTVGRVITLPGACAVIEIAPSYHDAHPEELVETIAHEVAHVLHPGAGHSRVWRDELTIALAQLDIPVRHNLVRARHGAPASGRYVWLCTECEAMVAVRTRRRRDEVSSITTCCRAPIEVFDVRAGVPAERRPFEVGCRRCAAVYVAYDDHASADRFARTHRCRCGGRLTIAGR